MPREAVRPGRGDLSPFLQVARRPEADRLAETASARPHAIDVHVGRASTRAATLAAKPRGTRSRARRADTSGMGLGGGKTSVDGSTHILDGEVLETAAAPAAPPLIVTHAVGETREADVLAASHGPLRAGSVGPNSATTGVPTAAATCSGPVSPDTIRRAPRASARRSPMPVGGRGHRRSHSTTRRRGPRSPVPRPPQDDRQQRVSRGQRRCDLAEPRWRPPFVRPRRARIDERVAAQADAPDAFDYRLARARLGNLERELPPPLGDAEQGQNRQVPVDDVPGVARVARLRVEAGREPLAQVGPGEPDHARRPGRSRERGRLQRALADPPPRRSARAGARGARRTRRPTAGCPPPPAG